MAFPLVEDEFALAVDEDVDVADPDRRIDADRLEDPQVAFREGGDRVGIEQVCRVGQRGLDRARAALLVRLFGQDHLEIEFSCAGVDLVHLDGEPGSSSRLRSDPCNTSITWNSGEYASERGGSSTSTRRSNGTSVLPRAARSVVRCAPADR